jgi:hypothetical protein
MDAAFIPGYSRSPANGFPMNDFPRIAVSDIAGTVSIVWNDARSHPAGDIYLESFSLGSLAKVQSRAARINSSVGGWHLLPALRLSDKHGNLSISFYGRMSANTAVTDVYVAESVNPRTTITPSKNTRVTTKSSDWLAISSDINPNFGDYTDNYVQTLGKASNIDGTLYVAWSDGRIGEPQPFSASINFP